MEALEYASLYVKQSSFAPVERLPDELRYVEHLDGGQGEDFFRAILIVLLTRADVLFAKHPL